MEVLHHIGESECPDGKMDENDFHNAEPVNDEVGVSHEMMREDDRFVFDGYEFDVQNLSCQSHDFEDDELDKRDHFSSGLILDNTDSVLDAIESEEANNDNEGSSNSEIKSLEQDEPQAVWVKWRGKWQSGIRCARVDWPLSTLKAKPTHDRKQYLVIFFPRTRNYSWADVLLVRPINEFPHPIAYKTHTVGVKMVRDLSLARRYIMQRLAVSMLNTLDQLNRESLSETARDVMVLKDFAREASRSKDYFDLGRMLLKLENMILQCYIASNWVHQYLQSWKQRCKDANSAESIEMLKEELTDSISWDKVNSLPTTEASPSDWKNWKHEAMKWFSVSHPPQIEMGSAQPSNNNSPPTQPNKRPKLEIRRADTNTSGHSNPVETNSTLSDPYDVVVNTLSQSSNKTSEAAKWNDIVVEAAADYLTPETTSIVSTEHHKPMSLGNHGRQCAAFIESKWRQCVRYASEGDLYCCVHLSTRSVGNSNKKSETTSTRSVDSPMCGGTTVLGTKCKHRALVGSSFCKKHRKTVSETSDNLKGKSDEVSVPRVEFLHNADQVFVKMPEWAPQAPDEENILCVGSGNDEEEPCLESPKRHSLYCEKHIPKWLKRARNGKTRIVSKEVYIELLKSCPLRDQKLRLHQACELFYRLFKSVLSLRNPAPMEVQFQSAISEASKDARVGEYLMKLIFHEKDRITKLWGFGGGLNFQQQSSSAVEEFVPIPVQVSNDNNNNNNNNNSSGHGNIIKCKICLGELVDNQDLGNHWMENHKKESQWLFRGYVCAICLDSFTNRKVLEAHVQERHHAEFVEQCMLLQCIPCGSHFGNLDQLWAHVLSTHQASLRFSDESHPQDKKVGETNTNTDTNTNAVTDNNSVNRRFICKFCGLKFDLLPDLGRHHQAAHMGIQTGKKGIQFYAQKLKSGRRFKKALNSASYKIRNRSMQNLKKRIQSSKTNIGPMEVTVQSSIHEPAIPNLDRLANSECSSIAKTLIPEIKKTKPRPSNSEILSIATSACCKVSLQASLEGKYGILPQKIYLKAAKLCSEQNILIEWHRDGFVCSKGCRKSSVSVSVSPVLTPVGPTLDKPSYSLPPNLMALEWTIDECHCVIDSRHFSMDLSEKNIVLCDDISFGQESIPIPCVVDEVLLNAEAADGEVEFSFPWESFSYITKPMPDKSFIPEPESFQLGCACGQAMCSSVTCDHVYLFNNDYEDAKDIHGKPMLGRFPYDERGRIILEEGYLVYECNQRCCCTKACQNRVLQNGVKVKLEIFKTEKKGWAVRTRQAILRGTFVCEYIGEIIDENERRNRCGEEGSRYHFEVDSHVNDMSRLIQGQIPYVIDATNYGNVSRYINHSRSPNLVNRQVLVESMDSQLAHIGFYASRDIAMGEELTYDYRGAFPIEEEGCIELNS